MSRKQDHKKIIGLVLAGGKSSRMGSDKAKLKHDNQSWLRVQYEKLRGLGLETYISTASEQKLPDDCQGLKDLVIVDEPDFGQGPLCGLLSAHQKFEAADIFVLACDVIHLTGGVLVDLFGAYHGESGHHVYYFQHQDEPPQVLAAIYDADILSQWRQGLASSDNFSLVSRLQALSSDKHKRLEIVAKDLPEFRNLNSPTDI